MADKAKVYGILHTRNSGEVATATITFQRTDPETITGVLGSFYETGTYDRNRPELYGFEIGARVYRRAQEPETVLVYFKRGYYSCSMGSLLESDERALIMVRFLLKVSKGLDKAYCEDGDVGESFGRYAARIMKIAGVSTLLSECNTSDYHPTLSNYRHDDVRNGLVAYLDRVLATIKQNAPITR